MKKVTKLHFKDDTQRGRMKSYQLPSSARKICKDLYPKKKLSKPLEKKDWEGVTCAVCLEHPHNAVLLLCSSYDKGCRPYMCASSRRFSNCLEQYKKAYTKVGSNKGMQELNLSIESPILSLGAALSGKKMEVPELLCPLCRGQVKGWTVLEAARKFLNNKKRTCMQSKCAFVGNYKQLRKHVKVNHPTARPRAVDPALEEKWKKLEREREREDVISTIMSSTPGALVLGDYVIEPGHDSLYSDEYDSDESLDDGFFDLDPFDPAGSPRLSFDIGYDSFDSLDEDDEQIRPSYGAGSSAYGRGFRRMLFSRSGARRLRGGNSRRPRGNYL